MHSCTRSARLAVARATACVLGTAAIAAGCGFQSYEAKPVSPADSLGALDQRSTEIPALRQFMAANGYDEAALPVREWGLRELTLLAFFYHADLDEARARVNAASAAVVTAGGRPNPAVKAVAEHHSISRENSPWTTGLSLDIPVLAPGKRAARIEHARLNVEVERMNLADTAWSVRSRVRSRLLDFFGGQRESSLLDAEVEARSAIVAMLERRFAVGMSSGTDLSNERIRLADARRSLERQRALLEGVRVSLAAATGLPMEQFNVLRLSFSGLELTPGIPDARTARTLALTNRIDVQRALIAYGMAEAGLKLEVASQYPDFSLTPGYRWDRGDNLWSLGIGMLIPVLNRNEGPILEAKARRELEAQHFSSVQARVIVDTQASVVRLQSALSELRAAGEMLEAAQGRNVQAGRRFELGYADRLEQVTSNLELMTARRTHNSTLLRALAAQGQLEDTLQRPLGGSRRFIDQNDLRERPRR